MSSPETLSITLSLTDEIRAKLNEGEHAVVEAQAYVIDSATMAQEAADQLTVVKRAIVKLDDLRKGFLAPAKQIIDNANALFNPALEGYRAAEGVLKTSLAGWSQKEQERVRLENLAREEEARKLRQKAEAEAAAAQARAAEEAAAKRRAAEEAEAARVRAEAEGNAKAAAAAAAKAAKLQEQAQAAEENGAAQATAAHLAAAAVVTAAAPAAPVKIAGASMRDNWIAELLPNVTAERAKVMIVQAAANRPDLLGLIEIDESAINKLAKALKKAMSVPGYTAENRPIVAGSRK